MKFLQIQILVLILLTAACARKEKTDEAAAAPAPEKVEQLHDLNLVKVPDSRRFPLVSAGSTMDVSSVVATGSVTPDIQRSVPVISLASGRVVEIDAKLGDNVRKGQVLLKIQSNDLANALQNYKQAKADEVLAKKQLERAQVLYQHGAIALNDLQVAEDAEEKARVAVEVGAQQVRNLGGEPDQDNTVVLVTAPVSGTITDQNISPSGAVHTPDNQANLFTISDLSDVWILCDVYENDLPAVRLGDAAEVSLNAYPGRVFRGRIADIGKVLDPNLRSAKVRIVLPNPGFMRIGMFVSATFYGQNGHERATVPSKSVLHLHDRDWVYVPDGDNQFRRIQVTAGKVQGASQELLAGISPGDKVVADPLALSAETEQ